VVERAAAFSRPQGCGSSVWAGLAGSGKVDYVGAAALWKDAAERAMPSRSSSADADARPWPATQLARRWDVRLAADRLRRSDLRRADPKDARRCGSPREAIELLEAILDKTKNRTSWHSPTMLGQYYFQAAPPSCATFRALKA
jgi:hypothetical protein